MKFVANFCRVSRVVEERRNHYGGVSYQIVVPKDLGNLAGFTANGNISVENVGGEVSMKSENGAITATSLKGTFSLSTTNGSFG